MEKNFLPYILRGLYLKVMLSKLHQVCLTPMQLFLDKSVSLLGRLGRIFSYPVYDYQQLSGEEGAKTGLKRACRVFVYFSEEGVSE